MSYLVLARKWRPMTFEEVVNQKHVIITLQNALKTGRLANAYLFSGPRGVGKTTVARILAKAVNCCQGPTPTPCNACDSCTEITDSRSLDVFEIDGASNRGIDEVRNLRGNIKYAPSRGKYKIYIIDEVHMLTPPAFNALLKTLEEPPPNVLFIFATTEPHKVLPTILSRCQRFDFKRISTSDIMNQLRHICTRENINIDEEALHLIARKSDGSMRDGQSLLDQAVSYCGKTIAAKEVAELLGIIDQEVFFEVSNHVRNRNMEGGLQLAEKIFYEGYDVAEFLSGLAEHFRNILIAKSTHSVSALDVSEMYTSKYLEEAQYFQEDDLLRLIKIVSDAEYGIKRSPNPRLRLEMTLVKMIKLDTSLQLGKLLEGIEGLKRRFAEEHHASFSIKNNNPATAGIAYHSDSPSTSPGASETVKNKGLTPSKVTMTQEPADAVPISMESLLESWPQVIEAVKKKKIALGSFLNEGHPTKVEDGILEISFGMDNGFHINSINKNKKIIEDIISQIVGVRLRVKCIRAERENRDVRKLEHANETRNSNGIYLEKLAERIPVVQTIVEVFDAELVR